MRGGSVVKCEKHVSRRRFSSYFTENGIQSRFYPAGSRGGAYTARRQLFMQSYFLKPDSNGLCFLIGNGKAQPPVSVYPHIEFHGGQRRRLAGRAN